MKTELLGLVAACALLGSSVAANASPYVVTLEEVGSNVVATGSGAIDTTGLFLVFGGGSAPGINPLVGGIATGTTISPNEYGESGAFAGPTNFGPGGGTAATSGTGTNVGILGLSRVVDLTPGYVSDTPLSDGAIYDTATFASLGATPGTYVWTWGTGADQSFTLEIGTTPLPAALPLFATGIGAIGLLGWRRKRTVRAVA